MNSKPSRIQLIAQWLQHPILKNIFGLVSEQNLNTWLDEELSINGQCALHRFVPKGDTLSKAIPASPFYHIIAGNNLHGCAQSLLRGLLVGGLQYVKLPSQKDSDVRDSFEIIYHHLPKELQKTVSFDDTLQNKWLQEAGAVIVFGSDETVATIASQLKPWQKLIAHGHKMGLSMISYMPDSLPEIAKKLVYDVATMDQTGCLSVQNAYLIGYSDSDFNSFLNELESAFQEFTSQQSTPEQREISVYGAIHNLREIYTYKAANEARTTIRHSRDSSWTIIHDPNQLLQASPSGNVLFLHRINSLVETATIPLPPNNRSSVSLYPYSQEKAERLLSHFPCPRISPLGLIQKTPLMWNADGFSPLHSLVNWVDLR